VYRKINPYTISDFIIQLSYENWEEVFGENNVDLIFNAFLNSYLKIFNSCLPLAQKQKNTKRLNIPWITTGIRVSCERKKFLYSSLIKEGNPAFKDYYSNYCKILKKVIVNAKKMAYDNVISKSHNNLNSTWKIINSETGRLIKPNNFLDLTNKFKNQNVTELINDYFITIGSKSAMTDNDEHGNNPVTEYLPFMHQAVSKNYPKILLKPTTPKEIENIIKSFAAKDSFGYDLIPLRIIKHSAPYISSPLSFICSKILQSGVFPERLKYAVVKPIYKKGDKTSLANYRPISLLTSFSKVVERVMHSRLVNHLKKYSIISPNQYGFQGNLSTDNAIYTLLNESLNALKNKLKVKGLFCDVEKAFDSVNHKILSHKLEIYGITGESNKLYSQYLMDRYQRVSLEDRSTSLNITSNWSKIQQGVPQGSVLGPLLFLLYINDLPLATADTAIPILFADDTSLLVVDKSPQILGTKLCDSLKNVNKWFKSNLLSLNLSKTFSMQFRTKKTISMTTIPTLNIYGIEEVTHTKFLGLEIDDVLSWDVHIDTVVSKLSTVCYMIRSIRPFMTLASLVNVYYSLFHSVLTYGIIFWGQATSTRKLFIIQKRAVRLMTGYGYRHSCRNLFRRLGILPLKSQYIYSVLLFVSKNWNLFTANSVAHNLQTRQKDDLHLPTPNLTLFQKGIYYTGVKLFNNLPRDIKEIVGLPNQFKSALKRYLVTHSFYELMEYYQVKE
jgi:hypothetical protein